MHTNKHELERTNPPPQLKNVKNHALLIHATKWMNLKHNVEQKKADTKEWLLYNYIHRCSK